MLQLLHSYSDQNVTPKMRLRELRLPVMSPSLTLSELVKTTLRHLHKTFFFPT